MPAFFFVAGVVWSLSTHKDFVSFAKGKMMRLLLPFVFFEFLCIVAAFIAVGFEHWYDPFLTFLHGGGWPISYKYNWVLWFPPCMFVVLMAYYWIDKYVPLKIQSIICVGLFVCDAISPHGSFGLMPWSVNLLPYYLAFVILGRYSDSLMKVRHISLIAFPIVAAVICSGLNSFRGVRLLGVVLTVSGVVASMAISRCSVVSDNSTLKKFGALSFGVMLVHMPILDVIDFLLPSSLNVNLSAVIMFVIGSAVSFGLVRLMSFKTPILIGAKK